MKRLHLLLAFALLMTSVVSVWAKETRPNLLFIMSDDHSYNALSCYGSKINKTPNLDRIAKEGIKFNNCLVTNSICGPCRAVILTGKYSHQNGFVRNGNTFNGEQLTYPKLLQKAGYQTAVFGKWHLKSDPTGFDDWEVLVGQGPYYNPPMKSAAGTKKYTGYTTEVITDITMKWLKEGRDPDKPFLLVYQHKAPHRNWQPGPDYLDHYDDVTIPEPATLFDDYQYRASPARNQAMEIATHMNANDLKLNPPRNLTPEQKAKWDAAYGPKNKAFKAMNLEGKALVRWKYQRYIKDYLRCIDAVDDNVGIVLDYLDESGLAENTLVVYTSDQSFYLGEHGWFDKRWMYEESLRTPCIIRWPGHIKPGSTNDEMISNLDFAETFLDIAGVDVPKEMQGASFKDMLNGKTIDNWRKSFYYHYYEFPGAHSVARHYGVRTERYKLISYYELDEWELFDLKKDPMEMKSVYGSDGYRKVQADMEKELVRLREYYKDDGSIEDFGIKPPMKKKRGKK
ncbi:MAG: sulfatase [Blastopirellula sp.]|nr:MAG: sulfatase [Blastopirellula sp.]